MSCAGIASNCFSLLKSKFTSVFSTFPPIFRNLKLPKRQNCVRFNLGNWIFQKIDTWYLMVERRYGHFSLQLRNIDGSNSIRHLNETVSPFSYTLNDRGSVLDGSSLQLLIVLSLDMRCTPGNWSGDSEAQYNRNTCSLVFSSCTVRRHKVATVTFIYRHRCRQFYATSVPTRYALIAYEKQVLFIYLF